ncbi:DUF1161 domain-containing protein [Halomonas sp. PR-M31]|uniref:DUF1161 domain-containing protein n=1 Tax=Halomonas sp. PR-M31 TaxID=1471202 RepID=UPI000B1CDE36|nr:DUF1161 domain-containing protein [Halomonas sp. PR-M31]
MTSNASLRTVSRSGQCLILALGLLLVSVPALSQAPTADERTQPRVRSTFKAVTPGTPLSNGEDQRQMRVEPMQPAPRSTPERPSERPLEETSSRIMNPEAANQACRNLQNEIAGKIRANQVSNFTLEAVPAASAQEVIESDSDQYAKVEIVGSCGDGAYKVVYRRG